MTTPEILAALAPVADALDRLGVPHHIGGSVASSILGVARATLDVDLVADLAEEHVRPLVAELGDRYYVSEEAIRTAVRGRRSFNLIHLETMLKVDVFILGDRAFDRESFGRRRRDTLDEEGGRQFFVASAEDTVLHKLDWYRQSAGVADRQWRDVLGVLRVQGEALDLPYLDQWADALGITDLLDRARLEAWGAATPPPPSPPASP